MPKNITSDLIKLPTLSEESLNHLIEDIIWTTLHIKENHYVMWSYFHERGFYEVDNMSIDHIHKLWETVFTIDTIIEHANLLPYSTNRLIAKRHLYLCVLFGVINIESYDYDYKLFNFNSDEIPQSKFPQLNDIMFCHETINCIQDVLGSDFFNKPYNQIIVDIVNIVNNIYGCNISVEKKFELCHVHDTTNRQLGTWDSWYFGNTGSMLQKFKRDWKFPVATKENVCNCEILEDNSYIPCSQIDYDLVPDNIYGMFSEFDLNNKRDMNDFPSYISDKWGTTSISLQKQNVVNIISYSIIMRNLNGFINNANIDMKFNDYDYNECEDEEFDNPSYKKVFIEENLSQLYDNFITITSLKFRCEQIKKSLNKSYEIKYPTNKHTTIDDKFIYHEFVNQINDIMNLYGRERRKCFNDLYRNHCTEKTLSRQTAFNQMKNISYNLWGLSEFLTDNFTDMKFNKFVFELDYKIKAVRCNSFWIWDYDAGYNVNNLVEVYKKSHYTHPEDYCQSARQFYENCLEDCIKSGQMSFNELMQLTQPKKTIDKIIEDTLNRKSSNTSINPPSQSYKRPSYRKTKTAADPIRSVEDIERIKNYFLSYGKESLRRRNYTIFCLGISTGLRASDLLTLKIGDVFKDDEFVDEVVIREKKTGNITHTNLNAEIKDILFKYFQSLDEIDEDAYLFPAQSQYGHLQVKTLYDMFDKAQDDLHLDFHFSTHSLRKTFAYWTIRMHYYDQNIIFSLQDMLNHRDIKNTLYYSGHTKDHLKTLYDDMGKVLNGTVEDAPAISTQEQKINQILDMLTKQIGEHTTSDEE